MMLMFEMFTCAQVPMTGAMVTLRVDNDTEVFTVIEKLCKRFQNFQQRVSMKIASYHEIQKQLLFLFFNIWLRI